MASTLIPRPFGARTSAAAAVTAITLTVGSIAPPALQPPSLSAPHVSTQTVELAALPEPLQSLWDLASGADPAYPLPTPSNPIVPVAEQFVRNLASYAGELAAGQGAQIPGQISARIQNVGTVLQSVPGYLQSDIASIPAAIGGGAFLGFLVGGVLVLSVVQALSPNGEPGPLGELAISVAVPIVALSGAVVGAALGLATTPIFWLANALRFRNSFAMALASPVPQPASASQPAAAAEATSIDSRPGTGTAMPTIKKVRYDALDVRDTIAAAPQLLSSQPDPETAEALTEPEPTVGLVEPEADRTAAAPGEPGPDRTGTAPMLRTLTKHLATSAQPTTKTPESVASKTSSSPGSDKTVSRPFKGSERPAAATSRLGPKTAAP